MKQAMIQALKVCALFILAMPSLTWAGTPDQDLIVDIMRERFKGGSTDISEADLALGKKWRCVYYTAQQRVMPNYGNYHSLFNFSKDPSSDGVYLNDGMFEVKHFSFDQKTGLVGTRGDQQLYARKASGGALVFEDAAPQTRDNQSYISVSSSKLVGQGYIYCKLPQ